MNKYGLIVCAFLAAYSLAVSCLLATLIPKHPNEETAWNVQHPSGCAEFDTRDARTAFFASEGHCPEGH